MTPIRIPTEFVDGKVVMVIEGGGKGGGDVKPFALQIMIPSGREGRELGEAHILLRATGGEVTERLREHFRFHFSREASPDAGCQFCKLQGKILAAEGRRRLRDGEERGRGPGRKGGGGEVQVRRGGEGRKKSSSPRGVSGKDILVAERKRDLARELDW